VIAGDGFYDVVLGGVLKDAGMASFAKTLSKDDATAIRAYVVTRAQVAKTGRERST
jgi:quinohemoprotein ethanol dehydrogenase